MIDTPEVTGRDGYIIARALYEFIRLQEFEAYSRAAGIR